MLHNTKAIILRVIPFGDTSLIITALTYKYGLQTYIAKGARRQSKKGASMAFYYQPAALLDLVVYHNPQKNMHIIKEASWYKIYNHTFQQIVKNSVALFMVELLYKSIKQPEQNEELFHFAENNLLILDEANEAITANIPVHFSLHLAIQLGFGILPYIDNGADYVDLKEGVFTNEKPSHPSFIEAQLSTATLELLQTQNAITLYRIKLNKQIRRNLLIAFESYYQLHIADFGSLKTVKVLEEVL